MIDPTMNAKKKMKETNYDVLKVYNILIQLFLVIR